MIKSLGGARRTAGYGAALSLSLYLVVKLVWVLGGLLGHGPEAVGTADWVLLNASTVGMSAVGIALGLALARPWGMRLPARPVVFFAWMGAGFLIPMLPYSLVRGALGAAGGDGGADGETAMPDWEGALIGIGFTGMAAGLAVALPIYMRERWPEAFRERSGRPARGGALRAAWAVLVVTVVLAVVWFGWAGGGDLGLDPDHRYRGDVSGRVLYGNSAAWALVGAWSVWAAALRPRAGRLPWWLTLTLGFVASGYLFAWSSWKLPLAVLRPGGHAPPEQLAVAVVEHLLCIGAGLIMLALLLGRAGDQVVQRDGVRGRRR